MIDASIPSNNKKLTKYGGIIPLHVPESHLNRPAPVPEKPKPEGYMEGGFVAVSNQFMQMAEDKGLRLDTRYLYVVLKSHCNKKNECWPSQKHLAKRMDMSTRNVRRHLVRLVDAEIIRVEPRGYKSNKYILLV